MSDFQTVSGKDMKNIKRLLRNGDHGMDASQFDSNELAQMKSKSLVRTCPKTGKIRLQGGRSANEKLVQTFDPGAAKKMSNEELSTKLDVVLEAMDEAEDVLIEAANKTAMERAVEPKVYAYLKRHHRREMGSADRYLEKEMERAIDAWVKSIVDEVAAAERRGDGDVTSLDYHARARVVAEILVKMGARGSVRSVNDDLRDFEDELVKLAFEKA